MMYSFPRWDFLGNPPIWSVDNLPVVSSSTFVILMCTSPFFNVGRGMMMLFSSDSRGVAFFVDRNPLHVFLPCPLWVSSDSGKYLLTASFVSPGHDANWLFLMALTQVDLVGYPAAAYRYLISSGWVVNSYTLCIVSIGSSMVGWLVGVVGSWK